ncbi:unnamed protein product [Diatraea saccharalis]|uniref:Uncharacterized protein n=1 Tax=Diatraea saccharalis TaxID=40085 RepID=A0A9N9R7Q8_9NEOP|nr:unnamed protein product [Diatraea saccharalis]
MKPEQLSETSNECSSMLVIHGSNNTSLDGKSNESNSHERFSIFSDAACGEVLTSQHLIIDFTPVEEIDNEFVQRKCCSFWEFINSRKDLRHFMMTPGERESSSSTSQEIITEIKNETKKQISEPTAVSMLGFVEEKGLIDRTFEAKLPKSLCSLSSKEYHDNRLGVKQSSPKVKTKLILLFEILYSEIIEGIPCFRDNKQLDDPVAERLAHRFQAVPPSVRFRVRFPIGPIYKMPSIT